MPDPLSIVSAIGSAAKVANTLLAIKDAISSVDRSLQQLQREVSDLQGVMERMGHDFSNPAMRSYAFASQTGLVGNHWSAVLKLIERCDRTLSEMEKTLRDVPHSNGGAWTSPLRAGWLKFKEGDVVYYQSEIQILTRGMQFELMMILLCRDMQGSFAGQTFQVDLIAMEKEWTRLKSESSKLKSTHDIQSESSVHRMPVRGYDPYGTEWEGSTASLPSVASNPYLRQRQFDTAKEVDACLSSASDLLSTASTLCASAPRRSFGDEFEQSEEQRARIDAFLQQQRQQNYAQAPYDPEEQHRVQNHPTAISRKDAMSFFKVLSWICLLGPRLAMTGLLLAIFILFWLFWVTYVILWGLAQLLSGFQNIKHRFQSLKRQTKMVTNWFSDTIRSTW